MEGSRVEQNVSLYDCKKKCADDSTCGSVSYNLLDNSTCYFNQFDEKIKTDGSVNDFCYIKKDKPVDFLNNEEYDPTKPILRPGQ